MSAKTEEILESLKSLSLLEASELVKQIEEAFGVSAAASAGVVMAAPGAAGADGDGGAAEENPVHVKDIHATVLNQLGFDHEQLNFRVGGRPFRLTQPIGEGGRDSQVVEGILA